MAEHEKGSDYPDWIVPKPLPPLTPEARERMEELWNRAELEGNLLKHQEIERRKQEKIVIERVRKMK